VGLAFYDGDWSWGATWIGTAFGSALLVAGGAALIDLLGSIFPRKVGTAVRFCSGVGFAFGWVFSVLGSLIVGLHPVMLIYIVVFGGFGLGCGFVVGLVVGAALGFTNGKPEGTSSATMS